MRFNFIYISLIIIIATVITVVIVTDFFKDEANQSENHNFGLTLNDDFIGDLNTTLDLTNTKQVFRHVFLNLDNEVTIYPTENYYYFTFAANGTEVGGSLSLFAHNRDKGILGFGYLQKTNNNLQIVNPFDGGGTNYDFDDGVIVKKINNFKYAVTFEGKTVIFNLNDIGLEPPDSSKLSSDEIFVGPSFDESGLKFYLVYNNFTNNFYWILNESDFVPENFAIYSKDLVIGTRTAFVFFIDKENDRKILVGVNGYNVSQNNWYDGPFDQLPDNYIYTDQIEIKKYLEESYPYAKGKIDKYGIFLENTATRIPIVNYAIYYDIRELDFIEVCKKTEDNSSEFFQCITKPRN